jgi:hypothetical protein
MNISYNLFYKFLKLQFYKFTKNVNLILGSYTFIIRTRATLVIVLFFKLTLLNFLNFLHILELYTINFGLSYFGGNRSLII